MIAAPTQAAQAKDPIARYLLLMLVGSYFVLAFVGPANANPIVVLPKSEASFAPRIGEHTEGAPITQQDQAAP